MSFCVAVENVQSRCRDVQLANPKDDVAKLLSEQGLAGAVEVRLTTLMSDYRYWARAAEISRSF